MKVGSSDGEQIPSGPGWHWIPPTTADLRRAVSRGGSDFNQRPIAKIVKKLVASAQLEPHRHLTVLTFTSRSMRGPADL